ncbi:MAG: hypothetical protein HYU97_01880 [Deltaproteobacteria bacterium]|nr:hypothetical protein [Deltaproteobacteria bacterium]
MNSDFQIIDIDLLSDGCLKENGSPKDKTCELSVTVADVSQNPIQSVETVGVTINGKSPGEKWNATINSSSYTFEYQPLLDYLKAQKTFREHPLLQKYKNDNYFDFIADQISLGIIGNKVLQSMGRDNAVYSFTERVQRFIHSALTIPIPSDYFSTEGRTLEGVQAKNFDYFHTLLQALHHFRIGFNAHFRRFVQDETTPAGVALKKLPPEDGSPFDKMIQALTPEQKEQFSQVLTQLFITVFFDPALQNLEPDAKYKLLWSKLLTPELTRFAQTYQQIFANDIKQGHFPNFYQLLGAAVFQMMLVENQSNASGLAGTVLLNVNNWGIHDLIQLPNEQAALKGLRNMITFSYFHDDSDGTKIVDELFIHLKVEYVQGHPNLIVNFEDLISKVRGPQWTLLNLAAKRKRMQAIQRAVNVLFNPKENDVVIFDRNTFVPFDKAWIKPKGMTGLSELKLEMQSAWQEIKAEEEKVTRDPYFYLMLGEVAATIGLGAAAGVEWDDPETRDWLLIGASTTAGAALGDGICRLAGAKEGWQKLMCHIGGAAVGNLAAGLGTQRYLMTFDFNGAGKQFKDDTPPEGQRNWSHEFGP